MDLTLQQIEGYSEAMEFRFEREAEAEEDALAAVT